MTPDIGLPPELDALKNTVRQIIRDECVPLEPNYLAHPPQKANRKTAHPVASSRPCPVSSAPSPADQWARLNNVSKQTGVYTSFVPKSTAAAAWAPWAIWCWRRKCTAASSTCPLPGAHVHDRRVHPGAGGKVPLSRHQRRSVLLPSARPSPRPAPTPAA